MDKLLSGVIAGFIATIVLSALMIAKAMMGLMPDLNVIKMLSHMMGTPPAGGWIAHFLIGSVAWGGLFALIYDHIPGEGAWLRGVIFAIGAWLAMMIVVMPMAGAGPFGMNLGVMAPVMTLMLHLVFGAVMGAVYGTREQAAPAH